MKKQVRRGFTLPEILVTVTVVAVLAAVVVPAVTQYVNKGNAPSTQGDLDQIRTAITAYVADNRAYPTYLYDLVTPPSSLTTATWKGPYTSAPLSTATTGASFVSSGFKITLGPAITSGVGYLTTGVAFITNSNCQVLYDLDKAIDGSSGSSTDQASMKSTGMLVWTTDCTTDANGLGTSLRLMAIGS